MILISHDHLQHDDRYILSESLGLNIIYMSTYLTFKMCQYKIPLEASLNLVYMSSQFLNYRLKLHLILF